MLALIRKWLLILLFISVSGSLLYQAYRYRLNRDHFPIGTTLGGINVSGLTVEEARNELIDGYHLPVYVYHRSDHVEINPEDVGFVLDLDSMLNQVQQELVGQEAWVKFLSFVIERPLQPVEVPLLASHDSQALKAMISSIASFLDEPVRPAQMLSQEAAVHEGTAGYITDVEASTQSIEEVLYRMDDRAVQLTIVEEEPPEMNMALLKETIETKLQSFNGTGSIFVMDLETGEEIGINSDVAMSGLSILKIAIFVEAYRAIDGGPDADLQRIFLDTATRSSNYGANLLLHVVAGENNTYRGADILTESMQKLGLENTFMAVPYDASPPAHRQTTYVTPANSRSDISTQPDDTMQSTAEEIGTLLAMIYNCSRGGGALVAVYPEEITSDECQAIIDLMVLNEEGNLIRFGVPEGTPVSHKHGWAQATHADAGIVLSPGGDFVIVEYLYQPGAWLVADESFPVLREIARATYNYFNMDEPYIIDVADSREQIDSNNPFSENLDSDQSVIVPAEQEPLEEGNLATPAQESSSIEEGS
jgi:beta-lactamase class A